MEVDHEQPAAPAPQQVQQQQADEQQQQQPAEEEHAEQQQQQQQPTSLGFLQLQDAFKRMVAVGVDVVDQEVSFGEAPRSEKKRRFARAQRSRAAWRSAQQQTAGDNARRAFRFACP